MNEETVPVENNKALNDDLRARIPTTLLSALVSLKIFQDFISECTFTDEVLKRIKTTARAISNLLKVDFLAHYSLSGTGALRFSHVNSLCLRNGSKKSIFTIPLSQVCIHRCSYCFRRIQKLLLCSAFELSEKFKRLSIASFDIFIHGIQQTCCFHSSTNLFLLVSISHFSFAYLFVVTLK